MSNPFDKRSERQIGYEMELVRKQIAMDNLKYENLKYNRKIDTNYYDQSSESCYKLGNWCCLILIVCFFRIILNPKPHI